MMTTPTYKPLGLAQVCEIRDTVEGIYHACGFVNTNLVAEAWDLFGFDPLDVRQAAEEALANLCAE